MATHYKITELRNGLQISVRNEIPLWVRGATALGFSMAILAVSRSLIGNWSWLVAVFVAIAVFAGVRASDAQLRATNVEFVANGNVGHRGSRITRVVCTGDVRNLEFRDSTGLRSGLYAITERDAQCILAFSDYAGAMEIIDAIKARFPGLAETWHGDSYPGDEIITLGLGKSK